MKLHNEIRGFNRADFSLMNLLDDESEQVHEGIDLMEEWAKGKGGREYCGIFFHKDKPLFAGGWFERSPGILQVFLIPDREALVQRRVFYRFVCRIIEIVQSKYGAERLQTFSLPIPRIERWMRAIGFRCEGGTKSYNGQGLEYQLWSREKINGVWQPN